MTLGGICSRGTGASHVTMINKGDVTDLPAPTASAMLTVSPDLGRSVDETGEWGSITVGKRIQRTSEMYRVNARDSVL